MIATLLVVLGLMLALIEGFQPWQRPWSRPNLGWLAIASYLASVLVGAALRT